MSKPDCAECPSAEECDIGKRYRQPQGPPPPVDDFPIIDDAPIIDGPWDVDTEPRR